MKDRVITIINNILFAIEIYRDSIWISIIIAASLGLEFTVIGDFIKWMAIPIDLLLEAKYIYISLALTVIFWIERLNIKKLAEIGLSEKMIKAIKIISILSVINTPFQVFMIYISRF